MAKTSSEDLIEFYKKDYSIRTRGRSLEEDMLRVVHREIKIPDLQALANASCDIFGCTQQDFMKKMSSRKGRIAKNYFYHIAHEHYSSREIGEFMNRKSGTVRVARSTFLKNIPSNANKIEKLIISKCSSI